MIRPLVRELASRFQASVILIKVIDYIYPYSKGKSYYKTWQEAAELLVKTQSNIIAVLTEDGMLAGVITTWDITKAVADGACEQSVEMVMTRETISAAPDCSILDMVTELEQHQFSAMPIVADGKVLGMD
jgi:homoserine O-acetyltransferase